MEQININVDGQTKELVIRQGSALPLKEPRNILIKGTISSVYRWLEKKKLSQNTLINSTILVDRSKMKIELNVEETSPYYQQIIGKLELSDEFLSFDINTSTYKSAEKMAEFIRMNRSYFETHQDAMVLASELSKIKAKVNKELESSNNNRGDKTFLVKQVVQTNVPEKFKLFIPIFKGTSPVIFDVEVYFEPSDLSCCLMSPQANDIIKTERNILFDEQIKLIEDNFPQLVIIEV